MGSYERFIGILLEHYGGELPVWLTPGPGDRPADLRPPPRLRARTSATGCAAAGLRVELDERTESVGRKIRDAELRKIPYMLVVGDREQESDAGLACASTGKATTGSASVEEFIERRAAKQVQTGLTP